MSKRHGVILLASKGKTFIMTTAETTTAAGKATDAVVNKTAKAASVTAAAVSEALPTVVETVDVVATMPAKVVLNQKLVVTASILGGAVLGAGILFGIQKMKQRRFVKNLNKAVDEGISSSAGESA